MPSAPPANISVSATAVDTISITWGEVPEQERNGIVRGYKVYVKNAEQFVEHESVVNASVTTLEVSNLVHDTYYCVQLLAYTVADGALSACVNVTTLEGKNFSSHFNLADATVCYIFELIACIKRRASLRAQLFPLSREVLDFWGWGRVYW